MNPGKRQNRKITGFAVIRKMLEKKFVLFGKLNTASSVTLK